FELLAQPCPVESYRRLGTSFFGTGRIRSGILGQLEVSAVLVRGKPVPPTLARIGAGTAGGYWRTQTWRDLMGTQALVSVDISRGSEILEILDRANLKVAVALWTFLSEYEDWRLVLASRQFDSPDPRDAYHLLHEALAAAGLPVSKMPIILILPTKE